MTATLPYLYRAYRYRLRDDRAELRFLCERLRRGQVAVDVGCHKGAYTYWMRRRVGAAGAVFAFEPQPRQVDYLRRTFRAMRFNNVTLVPMAISNATGQALLHLSPDSTHGATLESASCGQKSATQTTSSPPPAPRPLPVSTTTLDAFFADQPRGPDFIKIDVEGHELAVLEGGRQTLQEYRPTLLVECEARHRPDGDVRPVFELLRSLGYAGSFFIGGSLRPLAEFDAAVHQRIDPVSGELPRGYVNNFAFEFKTAATGLPSAAVVGRRRD